MKAQNSLPIAIIGAGPVGLAAAAHLCVRNEPFTVFEAGAEIADSVRSWEHVSMFSPWKYNLDKAALEVLSRYDWQKPPENQLPSGKELIADYLLPLAKTDEIKPNIHLNSRVISVSKRRTGKLRSAGRDNAPFVLHIKTGNGIEMIYARAVIDASGTWKNPNPAGADGLFANGELENRNKIFYGIPDVLNKHRERYLKKNVAVIGGGHSAIHSLLKLAELRQDNPNSKLIWILTKAFIEEAYGELDNDELPGRGQVGQSIKSLVESGQLEVYTPFFVEEIIRYKGRVVIKGQSLSGEKSMEVDEIITATGSRPDLSLLRELRIDLDPLMESPSKLASMIDPNTHNCVSVEPHGEAALRQPEKNFYIVGMKSYGRAPTFLLATGYEQVRSVVAGLAGDWAAARSVRLNLPNAGACRESTAVHPPNPKASQPKDLGHEIETLIDCLSKTPVLLSNFLKEIPREQLKVKRRTGKWSIHENACHLAQAEIMIFERFERLGKEHKPIFNPYLPGETVSDNDLINLDLKEQLQGFAILRAKTIELLRSYSDSIWDKPAEHPQYYYYNARILLRHTLMHDHFHMYRIEELWLTKPEFL